MMVLFGSTIIVGYNDDVKLPRNLVVKVFNIIDGQTHSFRKLTDVNSC